MDKIVSLAKRRGFVYAGSAIYGGLANSWDFGPLGVELKRNIKNEWWNYVTGRSDMYGLDSAIIMNPKVWEASGHTGSGFADPLRECKKCHHRFRADVLEGDVCPDCGGELLEARDFNILMKTYVGALEDTSSVAYLRGETAQGMFVNFKNILDTLSPKLPFGIAQIGKAFRNEITPGNFIFRTREFEQMEIEYFIKPDSDWNEHFEYWLSSMKGWMEYIGIDMKKVSYLEVPDGERAHYSQRTVDIEFEFPFGKKELYGLAYRGDYDLKQHQEHSGQDLTYFDEEKKERYLPHVIEPSLGVERTFLALLVSAYREEEGRVWLAFKPTMAPIKAAVFPLMANKPDLVAKAKAIHKNLMDTHLGVIAFDDNGNVGKRYRRQDEIGTPFCITVDFDTLEDDTITVRHRDSMEQERVGVEDLEEFLRKGIRNEK